MQSSIARLCLALGLGTALVGCTVEPLEPDSDAEFRSGNCQDAIDDGFDDGTFPSRWERNGDVVPSGFGGPICNMMLANGSGQQWCDNNVNGDLGLAPGTAEFFVFSQNGGAALWLHLRCRSASSSPVLQRATASRGLRRLVDRELRVRGGFVLLHRRVGCTVCRRGGVPRLRHLPVAQPQR